MSRARLVAVVFAILTAIVVAVLLGGALWVNPREDLPHKLTLTALLFAVLSAAVGLIIYVERDSR